MCNEAVRNKPYTLRYVPDHLKTQGMSNKVAAFNPWQLEYVPNHFKTPEMCNKDVDDCPWQLGDVPDHLKARDMCNKAVGWHPCLLGHVPDWFVTQQVEPWHNDELIEWYDGHKKRNAQKAKTKDELMTIAWHPSRWWNWCLDEDEKK